MPVRKDDDFQRTFIPDWDTWIEKSIREAQERGEFDDLPDHGKPIALDDSPFDPELASAYRTLKNAGYAPTWMEIDREITAGKEEMEQFLQRSVAYLQARLADVRTLPEPDSPIPQPNRLIRFWRTLLHGSPPSLAPVVLAFDDLVIIRDRMRVQYLERAAKVDKKVTEFHAALPRQLWHLERMRVTPEASAQTFDQACPPLADTFPGNA